MLWWWSSFVHDNVGLCGDLVSVGSEGTNYSCHVDSDGVECDGLRNTDLGNACQSLSPTDSPSTSAPTQ